MTRDPSVRVNNGLERDVLSCDTMASMSSVFVESTVNQIMSKRMVKKHQMR
jgi:hypothetical protein